LHSVKIRQDFSVCWRIHSVFWRCGLGIQAVKVPNAASQTVLPYGGGLTLCNFGKVAA